jgi:F-type H+-transporting ATPase subunit b
MRRVTFRVLRKFLGLAFLLFVAVTAFWYALPTRAAGQNRPAAVHSAPNSPSLSQQLVRESREAAGESDEKQFKQSPSVRLVAKITGLDLQNAYWLSVVLNFAIVAIIIVWAMKKFLPTALRNRTAAIQQAMEEARQRSEAANRRLSEIETRLARLDGEISQMRAAAEQEAVAEEQKIKAAAEQDARKIVESAEQEIAAAAKSARRELTAFVADLAVALARKQIHVDAGTDQALVRSFAQQLSTNGGDARKGGQ